MEDVIVVAGDLNGHVGAAKDGYRCHGGFGYGTRSDDGERVLEYADSHDHVIMNTKFRKRPSHLVSFYSGNAQTQIDFVLRYRDQKLVTDAKVVPYETVATQHRPLICTMKVMPPKRMHDERCGPARIKWYRLKEKEEAGTSRITLPPATTIDETWKNATRAIVEGACCELGTIKPGRRKIDKQTWLWTDEVRIKVRAKKCLYHVFLDDKTDDNWRQYLVAKKAAKKVVAATEAAHYDNISKQLDAKNGGERLIYRLAESRQRQTEDVEKFYGVYDEHGYLIRERKKATKKWCDYFEKISTEEFSHPPIPQLPPTCGLIQPITVKETMAALKRMKPGKATGPDDVAAELWKSGH
ncbi:hypothetical protein Y032_0589g370 [Ancylostoma ceylanicum]|nr:hypothetical protein Y032_0589g370 [Ancylostoma ceylanicum]